MMNYDNEKENILATRIMFGSIKWQQKKSYEDSEDQEQQTEEIEPIQDYSQQLSRGLGN